MLISGRFLTSLSEMTSSVKSSDTEEVIFRQTLFFYIKNFLVSYFIIVIILFFCRILGLELTNKNALSHETFTKDTVTILINMCFIGPIIEETVFRLWQSFKKTHIFVSLFVLSYTILTVFVFHHGQEGNIGLYHSVYLDRIGLKIAISLLPSLWILFIDKNYLKRFKLRYGHSIIITSVFVFALLHISNINCPWYIYPIAAFMCLPQYYLALSVTRLRLQIYFLSGLSFHCIINTLAVMISHFSEIFDYIN